MVLWSKNVYVFFAMESSQSRALSLFRYRGNCIFENAFGEEKGKFESGAANICTMHRIPSHALHTLYDKKSFNYRCIKMYRMEYDTNYRYFVRLCLCVYGMFFFFHRSIYFF